MKPSSATLCLYEKNCSGCPDIHLDYQLTKSQKTEKLLKDIKDFFHQSQTDYEYKFIENPNPSIRSRTDLTLISEKGVPHLGFYSSDRSKVLDISLCRALLPELNRGLEVLRKKLPAIKKGSLRIRVSPKGELGIWLDFSNEDIHYFMEQEDWLKVLTQDFYVEIGQRRKKLSLIDGKLKLEKESLFPWFETYFGEKTFSLKTQVASFTQPSFVGNKQMIKEICSYNKSINTDQCIEIGSGIGNFSIPLSFLFKELICLENDKWSLKALEKNMTSHKRSAQISKFDFRNPKAMYEKLQSQWTLFLDPPRSGVGDILQPCPQEKLPEAIIYVSCFPESFIEDGHFFRAKGYGLRKLSLVDQFPYTKHLEIVSLFTRD